MNLTPEQMGRLVKYIGPTPKQRQPIDWCYWLFFLWLLATVAFFIALFVSFLSQPDVGFNTFDRRLGSSVGIPKPHLLVGPPVISFEEGETGGMEAPIFADSR